MWKVFVAFSLSLLAGLSVSFIIPDARSPNGECPPRDTNETVYLTDTANCSIYYQCSNGRPIERVCPGDLVFNPEINVCDSPLNYDCENGAVFGRAPHTVVGTCPPSGEDFPPVLLPDSENCTIYYFCFNGTGVQNECWDGTEFNPVTSWCEDPETFDCNLPGSRSRQHSRQIQPKLINEPTAESDEAVQNPLDFSSAEDTVFS